MPPYFSGLQFGMRGPPMQLLGIEIVYVLAVAVICLAIYFKAKDAYRLSQHRGIYYFKNIFLYFSLSYLFRFAHIAILVSDESLYTGLPRLLLSATLFAVGYFGTMAILSLAMAAIIKNVKTGSSNKVPYLLHGIALVLSLLAAGSRPDSVLILLQTAVLFAAVLVVFLKPVKEKPKRVLSQNRMTYLLLAIFWIVNLLDFPRPWFPFYPKALLYLLSIGVFVSILLRVQKRLPSNAKKKRPA